MRTATDSWFSPRRIGVPARQRYTDCPRGRGIASAWMFGLKPIPMYSILRSIFHRSNSTTSRARRGRPSTSIECLESRIAPAAVVSTFGIGNGDHKSHVHFLDSDGDRVDVTLTHGRFDITLDGLAKNRADIDNINIESAHANSTLTIKVTSRVTGLVTSQAVTPGTTNVNSITSDFDGMMHRINLRSAEVQNIDLGNVELKGGLLLEVLNAARADNKNQRGLASIGGGYEAVTPDIDLNMVSLGSVSAITIRGPVGHVGNDFSTNDFDGAINVGGSLGQLVGANSVLHGSVHAGTLGGVTVAQTARRAQHHGRHDARPQELRCRIRPSHVGGNLNLRLGYAGGKWPTPSPACSARSPSMARSPASPRATSMSSM